MTPDRSALPDEFVSYVETRLPSVSRSARHLTGDERLADEFARDLILTVARRWTWLERIDKRRNQPPGTAADRLLARQFRNGGREIAADLRARQDLSLEPVPWPVRRSALTGELTPRDEAESLWDRAHRVGRRRLLVVGGLAVVGLAVWAGRPRSEDPISPDLVPTAEPPTARPKQLPDGVDVLPTLLEQTFLTRLTVSSVPFDLDLRASAAVGNVGMRNTGRAVAVFQSFETGPTLVLGPDGALRALYAVHPPTTPAVLSPDGLHAAFPMGRWIDVLEVQSGAVKSVQVGGSGAPPVWLDASTLLIGVGSQSVLHDIRTGLAKPVLVPVDDVIVPRALAPMAAGEDPARRVRQLLPVGQPVTASARVRAYDAGFTGSSDLAVAGTLAGWVGRWQGVGFSYGGRNGLMVRRCQVIRQLPTGLGEPTTGLAVISTSTGIVVRLLVDTSRNGSSQTEVLGWLDQETVLLTTGTPTSLVLLAWRIDSGVLKLVSVANRGARVAFADLAEAVVEPAGEVSPSTVASISASSSAVPSASG